MKSIAVYFLACIAISSVKAADYTDAERQANLALLAPHESIDSFSYCNNKIQVYILKDSILNKPGHIGTEYNYPIYKYETKVTFYEGKKLALFESKQIQLKRYEVGGVTTGITIITIPDKSNSFYFDQQQKTVKREQYLEIQKKVCKEEDK